jgi:hypothetical protein
MQHSAPRELGAIKLAGAKAESVQIPATGPCSGD